MLIVIIICQWSQLVCWVIHEDDDHAVYYLVLRHGSWKMRKNISQSVGKQFNCGSGGDSSKVIKVYEGLMCCKYGKISNSSL